MGDLVESSEKKYYPDQTFSTPNPGTYSYCNCFNPDTPNSYANCGLNGGEIVASEPVDTICVSLDVGNSYSTSIVKKEVDYYRGCSGSNNFIKPTYRSIMSSDLNLDFGPVNERVLLTKLNKYS